MVSDILNTRYNHTVTPFEFICGILKYNQAVSLNSWPYLIINKLKFGQKTIILIRSKFEGTFMT